MLQATTRYLCRFRLDQKGLSRKLSLGRPSHLWCMQSAEPPVLETPQSHLQESLQWWWWRWQLWRCSDIMWGVCHIEQKQKVLQTTNQNLPRIRLDQEGMPRRQWRRVCRACIMRWLPGSLKVVFEKEQRLWRALQRIRLLKGQMQIPKRLNWWWAETNS